MPTKLTLEITNGPSAGHKQDFSVPVQCTLGRGKDCTFQIPENYDSVSRHHCVLEVNPFRIRVKDLESLNGTYLNGECIGRRDKVVSSERVLQDGDELLLGSGRNPAKRHLSLHIHISAIVTKICAVCGSEVEIQKGTTLPDTFVCGTCRIDREALRRHLEAVDEIAEPRILSNYRLLQKIGRGGFGSVYLARHRETGQKVALKIMLPHIAHDAVMRQVFEREIENMKALRHPHIVELFEDGREGGTYYFTMGYCALGSVSSLMKSRGGTLPVDEALRLIHQAIDALHYAHGATLPNVRLADGSFAVGTGLVHRDIKPCNLLLDGYADNLMLKVGDYGLSKAWEQAGYSGITRPGTRAGSFAYQPRHQVRGYREAQPEVDVWATAATLYFMLTGFTPRDFPNGVAPELVVLQQPVVKIRDRAPLVPQQLADVIDHVLNDESELVMKTMAVFKKSLLAAT